MRLSKRAEFGLTNEFVICHIGRFSKLKNHSFVLSILKECLNKNENLKLLLVGDGELKDHVSQEIKDMCLENHVIMTGNRGDIGGLLSASDVFVLPSLIEGFPVVTLEAQANGLPTLVSDTLTTEIMITDSITMLSLESPSIWADHINQITSNTHKTDNIQKLRHAGFDIKLASCDLLKFYCKQLEIT
ncbi:MAG: glycosyltransferase [Christensenellaceae bacterium]|nr:glycosyltransferase [Christensenellaceae bacterium]